MARVVKAGVRSPTLLGVTEARERGELPGVSSCENVRASIKTVVTETISSASVSTPSSAAVKPTEPLSSVVNKTNPPLNGRYKTRLGMGGDNPTIFDPHSVDAHIKVEAALALGIFEVLTDAGVPSELANGIMNCTLSASQRDGLYEYLIGLGIDGESALTARHGLSLRRLPTLTLKAQPSEQVQRSNTVVVEQDPSVLGGSTVAYVAPLNGVQVDEGILNEAVIVPQTNPRLMIAAILLGVAAVTALGGGIYYSLNSSHPAPTQTSSSKR